MRLLHVYLTFSAMDSVPLKEGISTSSAHYLLSCTAGRRHYHRAAHAYAGRVGIAWFGHRAAAAMYCHFFF